MATEVRNDLSDLMEARKRFLAKPIEKRFVRGLALAMCVPHPRIDLETCRKAIREFVGECDDPEILQHLWLVGKVASGQLMVLQKNGQRLIVRLGKGRIIGPRSVN